MHFPPVFEFWPPANACKCTPRYIVPFSKETLYSGRKAESQDEDTERRFFECSTLFLALVSSHKKELARNLAVGLLDNPLTQKFFQAVVRGWWLA